MQTNTNQYDSNGLRHGLWVDNVPFSGVRFFHTYNRGMLHGEHSVHFEGSKKPAVKGSYKNGKMSYLWEYYDQKNDCILEVFYAD